MAALLFGPIDASGADPCALEDVRLAQGGGGDDDGVGGTGFSGEDGMGGTGHSGDDGIGGTGFANADGIGGTGLSGDDDGIGGTGFANADGIGGTGLSGDDGIGGTGIWGTITSFGSICVNGMRVQYDEGTSIFRNGEHADANALRVGQVVWIEATQRSAVELVADHIAAVSAVVGRVKSVDASANRFQVRGQRVAVSSDAIWADANEAQAAGIATLQPGDVVDVSGLRDIDGTIIATRIARSSAAQAGYHAPRLADLVRKSERVKQLSVEGFRGREISQGRFRIAGLEIEAPALLPVKPAARVWVNGPRSGATRMDARRVLYRPLRREAPRGPGAEATQLWLRETAEDAGPEGVDAELEPQPGAQAPLAPEALDAERLQVESAAPGPATAPAPRPLAPELTGTHIVPLDAEPALERIPVNDAGSVSSERPTETRDGPTSREPGDRTGRP
ncbi:MAG: DUF5666 domain-containing protein, partial [Myxococcota bacterium]